LKSFYAVHHTIPPLSLSREKVLDTSRERGYHPATRRWGRTFLQEEFRKKISVAVLIIGRVL
jgi:hypothetical protein